MPATRLPDANLSSDDRVAIVGQTGSGKTYLARWLLRSVRRLIVCDPKGTLTRENAPEWNLEEWSGSGERQLRNNGRARLRIPGPLGTDTDFSAYWDDYFRIAWEIGNVTVYIDEVYGVVTPGSNRPPPWLSALYTRGRERLIGTWAATQRPAWIPLFVLSESSWLFIFRLKMPQDRRKMAELSSPMVEQPITDQYGFWIYNDQWIEPKYVSRLGMRDKPTVTELAS